MSGTNIILMVISICFIILGVGILYNKKVSSIMEESSGTDNTMKYIKFNAKFNIGLGAIGVVLGIINIFLSQYSKQILMVYVVMMIVAAPLQKILNKRYK